MQANVTMQEVRLEVEELACKHCVRRVFHALQAIDGVVAVHIQDPPERFDAPAGRTVTSTVVVKFIAGQVQPEHLRKAVAAAGYRVLAT